METTTQSIAIRERWRRNLAVALVVMLLAAVVGTVTTVVSGELTLAPVFLWAGAGCVYVARRRVGTQASAVWVVLGLALFLCAPLVLR